MSARGKHGKKDHSNWPSSKQSWTLDEVLVEGMAGNKHCCRQIRLSFLLLSDGRRCGRRLTSQPSVTFKLDVIEVHGL